jgi:trimethylamine--corrinoid protein Co-methyltransferase
MTGKTIPLNLFRLDRPALISEDESGRVHALAVKILAEIGMEVRQPAFQDKLRQAGLRVSGERVFFEPAVVEETVSEFRKASRRERENPAPDDGCLGLSASSYSLFVHDLDSGSVVPYTSAALVEMTKLIDSLAAEGVSGAPPGIPTDVHPDLQPLAQYRIAALHARQGATPVDPTSARTVRYLFEMAEVMGRPIHGLPVYIPTPLRLGGESLDVVLACLDRLEVIWISSMPAAGTSAPIHPFGALALAAAEVIGGAIAVRILTSKPVGFGANVFPSDLREGAMVFGSPENMLFQMLSADFNRFYGYGRDTMPDNIHVMAKLPDAQSAAEKAAIMMLGAALGARHFSCAGTLSLDEIFSPEQLLLDCEIRGWVQRAIQGVWLGEAAGELRTLDDWLAEVRAGILGGFIARDSTLDFYRQHTWYPQFFRRGAIGPWLSQGQPHLSARLQAGVRRRIAAHDFELDAGRRRAIEQIYSAAHQAVEG